MKDEGRGRGEKRRDQGQQRDEEDSQSTSPYRTCFRQKRATHLHPAFSEGSWVQGPELVNTSLSMYVQRSTYIRSRYLASRIEKATQIYLTSSCSNLQAFVHNGRPNIAFGMWRCTHLLQIYVYSYRSNGPVPSCALYGTSSLLLAALGR